LATGLCLPTLLVVLVQVLLMDPVLVELAWPSVQVSCPSQAQCRRSSDTKTAVKTLRQRLENVAFNAWLVASCHRRTAKV